MSATDPSTFVVVGDWMTDIVATLPGPLRAGTDTAADVRSICLWRSLISR